jgi:hypothetical protein
MNTINNSKIFSAAVSVLFNYMLFAYLDKLEKCPCSKKGYNGLKVTKGMIIVNYIIIFGLLFVPEMPKTTAIFLTFYNITVAVSTFMYMKHLKQSNCKCSDSVVRDFYYYYYMVLFLIDFILLSMFSLVLLTAIVKN